MKKNLSKILTLAGFVLVGLAFRSSALAYTTYSPSPLVDSNQTSENYGIVEVLGTGISGDLANIQVEALRDSWTTANAVLTQCDDNAYSVNCFNIIPYDGSGSELLATIPTSKGVMTHDYSLQHEVCNPSCGSPTTTPFTMNGSKYYYFRSAPHYPTFAHAWYYGDTGNGNYPNGFADFFNHAKTYWIKVNTGTNFVPLTITSPPDFARTFPLDFNIPVDGTCPDNGVGTIVISFPNNEYQTESFDCTSNLFSISIPARDYGSFDPIFTSTCWLPSHTAGCQIDFPYVVSKEFYNYRFGVNYPHAESNGVDFKLLASNNFPFRYYYAVPSSTPLSSVIFNLQEYTDRTFTTASSTGISSSSTLATLTASVPIPTQEFEDSHIKVDSTQRYYRAWLTQNGDEKAFILISTILDSSGGQPATLPALQAGSTCQLDFFTKSLCWLIIPSTDNIKFLIDQEKGVLSETLPFSYFSQATDYLDGLTISTSTSVSTINLVIQPSLTGGATSTTGINIFGSSNADPQYAFGGSIRPYVAVFFYALYLFWLIKELYEFWKGGA